MQEVPLPLYTAQDDKIQRLEALVHRLLGDSRIGASLIGPLPEAASTQSLRMPGSYYPSGLQARYSFSVLTVVVNQLYAVPFYMPGYPNMIDRIAIKVDLAGAGGSVARIGVYDSDRDLYPRHLLFDAGIVSTASTGIKAVTCRQGFPRGLKWLGVVFGTGTPDILSVRNTSEAVWAILGLDATLANFQVGWKVAQTYGALPGMFPTGGAVQGEVPNVFLRFV